MADGFLIYPCYFLHTASGGLQCNDVDGKQCLCLFTSPDSARRFHAFTYKPKGHVQLALVEVENAAGLLDRLKAAESRLAADGIHHVVIDPLPGDRVFYAPIAELIDDLAS